MKELTAQVENKAKDFGFSNMFYTPDDIQKHIEKYSQGLGVQALTLLYGTINYVSKIEAIMAIKLEELKVNPIKLIDSVLEEMKAEN